MANYTRASLDESPRSNLPRDAIVCRCLAGGLLRLLKPSSEKEERGHNERAGS